MHRESQFEPALLERQRFSEAQHLGFFNGGCCTRAAAERHGSEAIEELLGEAADMVAEAFAEDLPV